MPPPTRPVRIAGVSGSTVDRRHGFADVARDEAVDYIVGDWMSEGNMSERGASKASGQEISYEPSFLESIGPALRDVARRKIKVAVNAGASDTEKLHEHLTQKIAAQKLRLKVAWVGGDVVTDYVRDAIARGATFRHLTTGKTIPEKGFEPLYAQCYLGAWGIVTALSQGADIVLCGRVSDASLTLACAAHYWGWQPHSPDLPKLAHALVAGHFLECSTYVTGGNFTGFKTLLASEKMPPVDLGLPIAEVDESGEFVVTMQRGRDGLVSVDTCKAQLLYEIQGPLYYNSDVVAVLDKIEMHEVGANRVRVTNVGFKPPPPTTKVGITALGGYQAEFHYFLVGLDIPQKAAMLEAQLRHLLDVPSFDLLEFQLYGSCPQDPQTQDSATVDLRIFAQARDKAALSPLKFLRPCADTLMQSYPGATIVRDTRQGLAMPFYEYWVSLMPQDAVEHVCHLPFLGNKTVRVPPPTDTVAFVPEQPSRDATEEPADLNSFGPAETKPLGFVVHARSGDKGSDANVGFWVRSADEWDWLRSFLSVDKVKELLGRDYHGQTIYRFELPSLWAVHFLLKDHLDRGVAASATYDILGKNVAEYLRCKPVPIPVEFLDRGRI